MYTLENGRCDIIGFNSDGVIGFYRHSAKPIVFKEYIDAMAFINYLANTGHCVTDISIEII